MQVPVAGVAPAAGLQAVTARRSRPSPRSPRARRSSGTTMSSLTFPPRRASTAIETPSRQRHSASTSRRCDGRLARPSAPAPRASTSSPWRRSASALVPSASAITMKPAPSGTPPGNAAAGRGQGAAVEVLERGHGQPGAQHPLDRPAARLGAGVEGDHGQRGLGRRQELEPGGGDHAERPLRADQQALQVVAGHVLADRPADRDDLAGRHDRLQPGHPGARDPVLEGVRAAGVGGDVAADLRLLGGAGIGREEEAVLARAAGGPRRCSTPPRRRSATGAARRRAPAVIRSRPRTTPPSRGTAPAAKPVPPPRGTIGTSCS